MLMADYTQTFCAAQYIDTITFLNSDACTHSLFDVDTIITVRSLFKKYT